MLTVQKIKNELLPEDNLKQICQIKSAFGNYSLDSQMQWIKDNIKNEDIHFMMYDNDKLVGYANLVNEFLMVDGREISILGLGSVCVDEKGNNKGMLLMSQINRYLIDSNKIGLLFCKPNLVNFYSKNDWEVILPNYSHEICWLIFNNDFSLENKILYNGKLF